MMKPIHVLLFAAALLPTAARADLFPIGAHHDFCFFRLVPAQDAQPLSCTLGTEALGLCHNECAKLHPSSIPVAKCQSQQGCVVLP